MMGHGAIATLLLVVLETIYGLGLLRAGAAAQNDVRMSWPNHGGGLSNLRDASFEKKISKESLANLALNWTVETGYDVTATPTIDGDEGLVFFPSWNGKLFAVKQDSGHIVWEKNLTELTAPYPEVAALTKYPLKKFLNITTSPLANLLSRVTPTISGTLIVFGLFNPCIMVAVDKYTGCVVWLSKLDEHPFCVVTQSATYYEGAIYVGTSSQEEIAYPVCCSFQGAFFKLDAKSGEILWRVPMLPDNHNQTGLYSGAAIWGSSPSIDVKRRLVYIATGNTYSIPPNVTNCELARQNETNPLIPDPCLVPDNHQESVLAINIDTGKIAWARPLGGYDTWTLVCALSPVPLPNCPKILGSDYDFGEAPFLLTIKSGAGSVERDVVVTGQKSGIVHTLDRETGDIVWQAVAGPSGKAGGSSWGMTTDGDRVFTNIINEENKNFTLVPSSNVVNSGGWVGLNASTGEVIWSTPNPFGLTTNSPLTYVNGVVFGGSTGNLTSAIPKGSIVALDAITGEVLWTYETMGGLSGGVSVSDGCIFQPVGLTLGTVVFQSNPDIHGTSTISMCVPKP